MHEHGVPAEVIMALRPSSAAIRAWGSSVEVTRALKDGDELKLAGRTLTVRHRPGHSPSDTVFLDSQRRMLIAGDHLIEHVSSNPIATPPLGVAGDYHGPRPQALVAYLESLRQTREMDIELVLPGHGGPISDHVALIDARLRMHARRAEKIHRLLDGGPLTAHAIAKRLWSDMAIMQTYLTLSEVLGHTDLLAEQGRISETEHDGIVRFAAS
jgi:glyoxylase-like metal-dependent hydrolase (beta-lactamase superfamily II)